MLASTDLFPTSTPNISREKKQKTKRVDKMVYPDRGIHRINYPKYIPKLQQIEDDCHRCKRPSTPGSDRYAVPY